MLKATLRSEWCFFARKSFSSTLPFVFIICERKFLINLYDWEYFDVVFAKYRTNINISSFSEYFSFLIDENCVVLKFASVFEKCPNFALLSHLDFSHILIPFCFFLSYHRLHVRVCNFYNLFVFIISSIKLFITTLNPSNPRASSVYFRNAFVDSADRNNVNLMKICIIMFI